MGNIDARDFIAQSPDVRRNLPRLTYFILVQAIVDKTLLGKSCVNLERSLISLEQRVNEGGSGSR